MLQIKTWCCSLEMSHCITTIHYCSKSIDTVSQFKLKVKGKHKLNTVVFQSYFSKFKKPLLKYCLQSKTVQQLLLQELVRLFTLLYLLYLFTVFLVIYLLQHIQLTVNFVKRRFKNGQIAKLRNIIFSNGFLINNSKCKILAKPY